MLNSETIINAVRGMSDAIYEAISEEHPENLLHSFEDQVTIARAISTGNAVGNDEQLAALYAQEHGTVDDWVAAVLEIDGQFRMARLQLTGLYKAAVAVATQADINPAVTATAIQALMAETQTLIESVTDDGSKLRAELLAELVTVGNEFQEQLAEAASESDPESDPEV